MKINFDKIRNYNQLMLSVAATIGVIILLFGCVVFILETTSYWMRNNDNQNEGILAEEITPQINRDTVPKQVISFQKIELVDSANQIFILPVTQADLVDLDSYEDFYRFSKGRRYRNDQVFNNLLLYDSKNENSEVLFDSRICITTYRNLKIKDKTFLFIIASSQDSNKDKYLNGKDLQELFVYDVANRALNKLEMAKNWTTLEIFNPQKTEIVAGSFGIDRNKDGEFKWNEEAVIFQKIDMRNNRLIPIGNKKQMEDLQKLLEGK